MSAAYWEPRVAMSKRDSCYDIGIYTRGRHAGLILVCLVTAACPAIHYLTGIPDLPLPEAAKIISRAPEFNRYARLLNVERVDHLKDSMGSVSYALFTFLPLNSAPEAPPIKGWADFRYWGRGWHLNLFDYGCDHRGLDATTRATGCHRVDVYNPPPK
jgi:hypothetical protein